MNLKDNLLNFISGDDNPADTKTVQALESYKVMEGLCPNCENIPHCIWVENTKINCEHYE